MHDDDLNSKEAAFQFQVRGYERMESEDLGALQDAQRTKRLAWSSI